uniref:Uncharacterized protein n=1 Tax=Odontella aurita TaxID=265563 RepID=A0A7S4IRE4_9STRA|mmetsp:Transcript_29162/g.86329  ORF Transcript_29162/g.86329 Transcript_29162/m.86329 type:complete len:347 (+) Transcript_29162:476-1516(+)
MGVHVADAASGGRVVDAPDLNVRSAESSSGGGGGGHSAAPREQAPEPSSVRAFRVSGVDLDRYEWPAMMTRNLVRNSVRNSVLGLSQSFGKMAWSGNGHGEDDDGGISTAGTATSDASSSAHRGGRRGDAAAGGGGFDVGEPKSRNEEYVYDHRPRASWVNGGMRTSRRGRGDVTERVSRILDDFRASDDTLRRSSSGSVGSNRSGGRRNRANNSPPPELPSMDDSSIPGDLRSTMSLHSMEGLAAFADLADEEERRERRRQLCWNMCVSTGLLMAAACVVVWISPNARVPQGPVGLQSPPHAAGPPGNGTHVGNSPNGGDHGYEYDIDAKMAGVCGEDNVWDQKK